MEQVVFYSLAAVVVISALAVVTLRNILHSALFLGISLAGVAGIFGALGADFLFAAQILVYVTGIAVLILFVVMLSGRASELRLRQINDNWVPALLICGIIAIGMWKSISAYSTVQSVALKGPTTSAIAQMLLGKFAVPFELISLILIVALMGAVLFTTTAPRKEAE